MPERYPLTVHVPVNGQVLIRLDGVPGEHEVGSFTQNIPVQFATGPGEVAFTFDKAFWEAAIENKRGVEPPTPTDDAFDESTMAVIEEVLKAERILGPDHRYLAGLLYTRLLREGKLK